VLGAVQVLVLAVAAAAWAAAEEPGQQLDERWDTSGRFYIYFRGGENLLIDDEFTPDVEFDTPNGINFNLGVGLGYDIDRHWSIEIEGDGTEPDIRDERTGLKVSEFSNITLIPAVRFRWPIGDGRFVPYAVGGVGMSINDVNDTANLRIKVRAEDTNVVGTLGVGFDYFLTENVSVGFATQSFIHSDIDTSFENTDDPKQDRSGTANLTSVAFLAHIRLYPGQNAASDGGLGWLLADHGPFDEGQRRYYLYALAGTHQFFNDDVGGDVTMEAPGGANWLLGGAGGLNLTHHWGFEIQLFNTETNLNAPGFGKFSEFSNFTVLPQARYRWQFLDGRLVLFGTGGVGVSFNVVNDQRQTLPKFVGGNRVTTGRTPKVDVDGTTLAGGIGAGIEYFLNRNLSIAISVPYYIYQNIHTKVQQRSLSGQPVGKASYSSIKYSGIGPQLQIRAYLP
jgi:opacity protein-like surface antigen